MTKATHVPDPAELSAWRFPPVLTAGKVMAALAAVLVILYTGRNVEIPRMIDLSHEAVMAMGGAPSESQVLRGLGATAGKMFPLQIEQRTEISRIDGFDPDDLPWLARLETVETATSRLDPETLRTVTQRETVTVLVEPLGYLLHVGAKLVETLEIALWGTLLAIVISAPLAFLGARNLAPHRLVYTAARAVVSLLRAVPEFVSALFLVVAYGFGPIAGILALALHAAGFLGKFYAEDIEAADRKPQDALIAMGLNRFTVLRYAILPQVWPQYIAYTLYVLDRNIRMATVIGIVGAGGIGQELKGRFDMFNYPHVGTILVAIFATVFVIDQFSALLRRRHL